MSIATDPKDVDIGEAIERRRIELHRAGERYLNGEIDADEYEALERELMPDYDEMGRHLYRVAKAGNTPARLHSPSMLDRLVAFLRPPRSPRNSAT